MRGTGTYRCEDCNWSGLRPFSVDIETKDGCATILSCKYSCPKCRGKVIYEAFE